MHEAALVFIQTVSPLLEAGQDAVAALHLEHFGRWYCVWPAPAIFLGFMFAITLPIVAGSFAGTLLLLNLPPFV